MAVRGSEIEGVLSSRLFHVGRHWTLNPFSGWRFCRGRPRVGPRSGFRTCSLVFSHTALHLTTTSPSHVCPLLVIHDESPVSEDPRLATLLADIHGAGRWSAPSRAVQCLLLVPLKSEPKTDSLPIFQTITDPYETHSQVFHSTLDDRS